MRRETWIVLGALALLPATILAAAALCALAIGAGGPEWLRLPFRFLCHGLPERSLLLGGVPMPVCARCTGIYAGVLAGLAAFPLIPMLKERLMRMIAFAAATPLAIDGLTQLVGLRESTNPLRIVTGAIAGVAFGLWILSAVEQREKTMFTAS